MKTEVRRIKPGLYRGCYDLGRGETTVPFGRKEEAEAFIRGVEHAVRDLESQLKKAEWMNQQALAAIAEAERRYP